MIVDNKSYKEQIDSFVEGIPELSVTASQVVEICSRIDSTPEELSQVVSEDSVLSEHVLKLVNSAYYSLVSEVTSLTRAITMLGFNTVKSITLSKAVNKAVARLNFPQILPMDGFWRHSISTGVAAGMLSRVKQGSTTQREDFLICGLLHDLGKMAFVESYTEVISLSEHTQITPVEAERELYGFDHQQVGLKIARKWQFNDTIRNCIGFHHEVDRSEEVDKIQTAFLALGDVYANIYDLGYAGNFYPSETELNNLLSLTGVSWAEFRSIGKDIEAEVLKAGVFLQL